ncbi:MAG: Hpt domain-containing protein [Oligoflexales bacterium]|nr:Hpt domain-containing protein [Oligoflexales bacterium]
MNDRKIDNSLGKKLLIRVLVATLILTAAMTMVSFYFEYMSEMGILDDTFTQIEKVSVLSVSKSVYEKDANTVQTLLDNVTKMPSISKVEIFDPKGNMTYASHAVQSSTDNPFSKTYQLARIEDKLSLGKMVVTATKKYLFAKIMRNALMFFFNQGIKTLLVSLVFFEIVNALILRPLKRLENSATKISEGNMDDELLSSTGEMDLNKNGESDHDSSDELIHISKAFVKMRDNIKSKIKIIDEYNRELEAKIDERTAELMGKTNDINAILQNMRQGILAITKDNKIHPEYSKYLEIILGSVNLAGKDVVDVLFEKSNVTIDVKSQTREALSLMLGEKPLLFSMNAHLLPKNCEIMSDNSCKLLEIDWNPVITKNVVEKIIVTVRDVTVLRKLQNESMSQKRDLEIIGEILLIPRREFENFIINSENFIEQNAKLIQNTEARDPGIITVLFRNMHTIKGNARTLGLKSICEAVHQAEQTYDGLRLRVQSEWDNAQLISELKQVEELIKKYRYINETKLGRGTRAHGDEVIFDRNMFNEAVDTINNIKLDMNDEAQKTIDQLKAIFEIADSYSFEDAVSGILKAMPILARELNKEPPDVKISDKGLRITKEESDLFKNILMHSFRNSIDHGIETREERKNSGKHPIGSIDLSIEIFDNHLKIVQKDDGRGLHITKIRQKAIEKGIITEKDNPTLQQIADYIFISGITTAKTVTHISGRGVGMDVIKSFVEGKGGKVDIILESQDTAREFIPFSMILTIPRDPQALKLAA